MIISADVVITIEKNGHLFRFCMPVGSSYDHAHEAALESVEGVLKMQADALEQSKKITEEPTQHE